MDDIVIKLPSFEDWKKYIKERPKLSSHVFKSTKLELSLSKTLPYLWILPLNKRQRVRLRTLLKYAGNRRASEALYKTLKRVYDKSEPIVKIDPPSFDSEDYTWTLDMEEINKEF